MNRAVAQHKICFSYEEDDVYIDFEEDVWRIFDPYWSIDFSGRCPTSPLAFGSTSLPRR